MRRAVIVGVILFALCGVSASADGVDELINDFTSLVPEKIADGLGDSEELCELIGFESILSEIYAVLSENGGALLSFFSLLMGLLVLTSLAATLHGVLGDVARACASAISAVAIFERVYGLTEAVSGAITESGDFFGGLIPLFAAVTSAGGGVGAATVGATGMSLSLGVIGAVSGELLPPFIAAVFALGLLSDTDGAIGGLFKSVKGAIVWILGILTFLLGTTLALQTVMASASDGILMRGAKLTASGMVPIVGGALSGAMSTLAAGLSYAKGFIGIGSVAVIVLISLSPLVLLLCYRGFLSLSVNFLGFLGTGRGTGCFSAMLGALDCLIAVFSMSTIVYIFEILLFIKSGVALL